MTASSTSAKNGLKKLRQHRAFNAPVTQGVRAAARFFGVTPEFAIRYLPRSGITRTSLPNGRELLLWSRADDGVSNQIFWRGWDGYETEVAQVFWRMAEKAGTILDIGAHVGYYTVLAAMANPKARVYALEPLPVVFERLDRNVRLNSLSNVVSLQQAAGSSDGKARFYYVPGIIPSSSSLSEEFMHNVAAGVTAMDVVVRRIDTIAKEQGFTSVDLVKIDTETTEPSVLAGMGELLEHSRPDIVCEVLPNADVNALTSILAPLDYSFFLFTDRGQERRETIVPDERWLNYLFSAR